MAQACSSHSASAAATEHLSRGYERLTQLRALLFSASPAACNSPRAALQAVVLLDKALSCLSAALAELQTSSPPARTAVSHGDQKDDPARKRRRILSSWTIITTVPHFDGYEWRKYGQKHIHGADFPRSYYKCTNSKDQGCPATKTVQEKGGGCENQTKFEVSYSKLHTCKAIQLESHDQQYCRPLVMDSSAANSASNNSAASPTPSHQSTNNSSFRREAASPDHDKQPLANLVVAENYEHDDQHLIDAMHFEPGDYQVVNGAAEINMLSPLAAFHDFAWEELFS